MSAEQISAQNRPAAPAAADAAAPGQRQRLHLVFGGELESLGSTVFRDPANLHIVGIFPDYASAYAAWKAEAQRTVDNAQMRYLIAHIHRLIDEEQETGPTEAVRS